MTTHIVALTVPHVAVFPAGDATRTVYASIFDPPLFTGAVHDTCIDVRYPVATTPVGASGTVDAGGGTSVDGRYFCVVAAHRRASGHRTFDSGTSSTFGINRGSPVIPSTPSLPFTDMMDTPADGAAPRSPAAT